MPRKLGKMQDFIFRERMGKFFQYTDFKFSGLSVLDPIMKTKNSGMA